jgi:hypothetical protein
MGGSAGFHLLGVHVFPSIALGADGDIFYAGTTTYAKPCYFKWDVKHLNPQGQLKNIAAFDAPEFVSQEISPYRGHRADLAFVTHDGRLLIGGKIGASDKNTQRTYEVLKDGQISPLSECWRDPLGSPWSGPCPGFEDSDGIWYGFNGLLLESQDQGKTWTPNKWNPALPPIYGPAPMTQTRNGTLVLAAPAGGDGLLLFAKARGGNWAKLNLSSSLKNFTALSLAASKFHPSVVWMAAYTKDAPGSSLVVVSCELTQGDCKVERPFQLPAGARYMAPMTTSLAVDSDDNVFVNTTIEWKEQNATWSKAFVLGYSAKKKIWKTVDELSHENDPSYEARPQMAYSRYLSEKILVSPNGELVVLLEHSIQYNTYDPGLRGYLKNWGERAIIRKAKTPTDF